jgi:hypothetical protein
MSLCDTVKPLYFKQKGGYARLGNHLLYAAIKEGGKYLSCFGEHLKEKLYVTNGFEVYESREGQLRNGKIETLYFMKLKKLIKKNYT